MDKVFFDEKNTRLKLEAEDWRSAIRLAAGVLVENGVVKPSYIDGIIAAVEEFGPYIVIGPGIAIPHARAENGVLELGCALVTFKEPIYFDDEDGEPEPVRVMIPFTAMDNSGHMDLLQMIMSLLEDESIIDRIAEANTIEELNQILG